MIADPPVPARLAVGDRFRQLHAHQRVITSDLTPGLMLQRIVQAAAEVVGVTASLLAVVDAEGGVEQTVAHGMGDLPVAACATVEELDHLLLAGGLRHRRAEIRVAGDLHAALFVAGPIEGDFHPDDLEMLNACSRSAGSAIEHAMLFHRARSSVQWLHASGEIARAMLADADIDALTEIVARAVEAADADYGHLVIPTSDGRLRVLAAHGSGIQEFLGTTYDADMSDLTRAVVNGKTLRGAVVGEYLTPTWINTYGFGPFMLAPLLDALGTRGSVLLVRFARHAPFAETELSQFATYTAQVALAMQFADARTDSERLQRVEARANASRELSDIVMQRLFAVGIGLDMLSVHLAGTPLEDKLARHITDLDETIEEIRSRVFVDGDAFPSEETKFPRLLLPDAATVDGPVDSPVDPPRRRGRRRSDWADGTGRPPVG